MKLFCRQFATFNGSISPRLRAFVQEKPSGLESQKEKPGETVDEAALEQAKRDYSEKWQLLKKFRDQDPATFENIPDANKQSLSARADLIIRKFETQVKADKNLVDPEKIYAPEEKDKQRIESTLKKLEGIMEKYGSEKQGNTPDWLVAEVLKPSKEKFNKAAQEASKKLTDLLHPILGGGDQYKNPYTNDYVRWPEAKAALAAIQERIGGLSQGVMTTRNLDFINAATAQLGGIDAEIKQILLNESLAGDASWAIEQAFSGVSGGKSFNRLPKVSQNDRILMERVQARLNVIKDPNLEKVPAGTTWKISKGGMEFTVTKGEGRKCTAKIDTVGLWIAEQYGASFVKYLAPEDRKYVKSYNEATGEIVVERTYPVPEGEVPKEVVAQYKQLDKEFDQGKSPQRVAVNKETYVITRTVEKGKKSYHVERVTLLNLHA